MPRRRRAPLPALALLLAVGLSACGGGTQGEHSDEHSSDSSPTASDSATAGEEAGEEAGTRIEIERAGDSITPNGERVEVPVGEPITLVVTADAPGELHVHSTPEQEIAYEAGTSEHEVTIDRPGVVEVESHEPHLVVLQLEVR